VLEIGCVVEATIIQITAFGVFLKSGSDTIFIPLDGLSWTPSPDITRQFQVGQTHQVFVERFNYEKSVYAGSLRLLVPEQNPYREFSALPSGTVIHAKVKMIHGNGITVELNDWCSGHLPLDDRTKYLKKGSEVDVQITSLELNHKNITLKLADKSPDATDDLSDEE